MVELGWKSVSLLELTALPTIQNDKWVTLVQQADVLIVSGGDALYLHHWMRECGLTELLPSLDAVWFGMSAGSMVMTPRIGKEFVGWKPPAGGDAALGLVDFSIFPHLDHPSLPENTLAAATEWAAASTAPRTRSTTTPRSAWSTARSTSCRKATGTASTERSSRPDVCVGRLSGSGSGQARKSSDRKCCAACWRVVSSG
jgi:hypothetical protein